jgi:hypothetical protein
MLLLDISNFDQVWQHICAGAREDLQSNRFIPSCAGRGGNWVKAVQPDRIQVKSRYPRSLSGLRWLPKSQFRGEWEKLVSAGFSSQINSQVVWDMFSRDFEDVEHQHHQAPLRWTRFDSTRKSGSKKGQDG